MPDNWKKMLEINKEMKRKSDFLLKIIKCGGMIAINPMKQEEKRHVRFFI